MKTKKEYAEKYKANVVGISKANNVDMGVSTDMLLYLIKSLSDQGPDFYPGVGTINLDIAVKDYRALEEALNPGKE